MATGRSEVPQPIDLNPHFGRIPEENRSSNRPDEIHEEPIGQAQQHGGVELISENRYTALELAALQGNWEEAKRFLDSQGDAATAKIGPYSMTALQIAAFKGHSEFVKRIVQLMPVEALGTQDALGFRALDYAATTGSLEAAVALINKDSNLPNLMTRNKWSALYFALVPSGFGRKSDYKEFIWYLASATTNEQVLSQRLVNILVLKGYLDVLQYLLRRFPNYLANNSNRAAILYSLARSPSNFWSGSRFGFWQKCIYSVIPVKRSSEPQYSARSNLEDSQKSYYQRLMSLWPISKQRENNQGIHWLPQLFFHIFKLITPSCIKRLQDAKHRHGISVELVKQVCEQISQTNTVYECFFQQGTFILQRAIEFGVVEILKISFQLCPQLTWIRLLMIKVVVGRPTIYLEVATQHRKENMLRLLMEDKTCFTLEFLHNTSSALSLASGLGLLHKVAKLPHIKAISSISGAALQMQREMQWFKAIEKFVPGPAFLNYTDNSNVTARESFTKEHKKLAEDGEKWMKDTANSCMIVSTLITTVVFAAAFTVPGGNDGDKGIPIFLWTSAFLVFAISNTLALFSSLTSLLMFLSILTARYAEEDFLESLPKRLIIGLASLFFAIATMIIAFGAALSIVLSKRLEWIAVPVVLIASFPVSIFAWLQLPLFIEMVKSTYWSDILS